MNNIILWCLPKLGVLGGRHQLYLSLKVPSNPQDRSLAAIIANSGKSRAIPQRERLRLAKMIATTVLKFNHTPWLCGFWNSEDVIVFSKRDKPLSDPHFRVRVVRPEYSQYSSTVEFSEGGWARVLFSLGIVLYELWTMSSVQRLKEVYSSIT
jgi:hypothetical protein